MRLDCDRIWLRTLTDADVCETYVSWLNDEAINRYLETRFQKQSLNSIRSYISEINSRPDTYLYGIFLKDSDRHIGNIKLGPIDPNHRVADISLLIGVKEHWGQGYATEAIRRIAEFAFCELNLRKLSASFYAENVGSIYAFERAGFSQEGVRKRHYLLGDTPTDVIEHGLCREDYFTTGGSSPGGEQNK